MVSEIDGGTLRHPLPQQRAGVGLGPAGRGLSRCAMFLYVNNQHAPHDKCTTKFFFCIPCEIKLVKKLMTLTICANICIF